MAWTTKDRETVVNVMHAMLGMQRASWEQGVAAQALLELHQSHVPELPTMHFVVAMAHDAVVRQEMKTGRLAVQINRSDPGLLDPASCVEPLLAAYEYTCDVLFRDAARKQVDYLMATSTPRTSNGTLYHRIDKQQLWVDGIYMGPPALAGAGVFWKDQRLLDAAVAQIRGYRAALWSSHDKLFSHIWDEGSQTFERKAYWGVGNGWALAGMLRVLFLLPATMTPECESLLAWIKECLDGVLAHERPDHLFHDILDDPSTFVETNISQQVAYVIFRLVGHGMLDRQYLKRAGEIRTAVHARVDRYGLVRGVCGSPDFIQSGTATEGQAFFILMETAYRDALGSLDGSLEF